jgi:hypothetical protein
MLLVLLLTSAAAALRLAFLGSCTVYHGEAEFAEVVAYVLPCLKQLSFSEARWRQWHLFVLGGNPWYWLYPIHIPVSWFLGVTDTSIRLPAALGGVASCLLAYTLVRRHADRRTALAALALLAFHPFLITFNRFGFTDSVQTTLLLGGLVAMDRYCAARRRVWLALAGAGYALAFLIKANAVLFILPMLALYRWRMGLRWTEAAALLGAMAAIMAGLFIDQLPVFLPSVLSVTDWAVEHVPRGFVSGPRFYLRAYLLYAEHVIVPIIVCLVLWRRIRQPLFRVAFLFSLCYFVLVCVQGRTFFRYLQIGMIMLAIALAFPVGRWLGTRRRGAALAGFGVYLAWGLIAHGSYAAAQYQHIPYRYLRERTQALRGAGRILAYGRNSETDFYLSPSHNVRHDPTVDPCAARVTRHSSDVEYAGMFQNLPPEVQSMLDPDAVRPGDLVVITGVQMAGGEPNPQSLGLRRLGLRRYGHDLESVRSFYQEYQRNAALQQQYVVVEKVPLSNTADELAALILRRI